MWKSNKTKLNELSERLDTLEDYAKKDYERLEELENNLGTAEDGLNRNYFHYIWNYSGYKSFNDKPKKSSLWEQFNQLKTLLGVKEKVVEAERKLVLSKKEAKKPAKKAKK